MQTIMKGGYTLNFTVPEHVKKFMEDNQFDLAALLKDDKAWTEVLLEAIDGEDEDGIPAEEFGKDFQIILHSVVSSFTKRPPVGYEGTVEFDKTRLVYEGLTLLDTKFSLQFVVVKA